jgi:plastocyanin
MSFGESHHHLPQAHRGPRALALALTGCYAALALIASNSSAEPSAGRATASNDASGRAAVAGSRARLVVEAAPKSIAVDPRTRQMNYRLLATKRGRGSSGVVRLCARKWPHGRLRLLGQRCETVANVDPGDSAEHEFGFRVLDRARGKLSQIRFRARGHDVEPAATTASLRVRQRARPSKTVIVRKYEFLPRTITVGRGDRVIWKGETGSHSVTFERDTGSPFGWERFDEWVSPGTRLLRTTRRRGTFRYYCRPHGSMRGKLIVR